MKTLLFTIEYPPFKGGVSNYYGNLVKYWPEKNNITVLDNNSGALLCNKIWPKWLPAFWRFVKLNKQKKFDHVIAGHLLPLGIILYIYSIFNKISYSIVIHGMDINYALRKSRKKAISFKILKKAKNIFCANSYTAGLVKDFMDQENHGKIKVVNPGIDVSINFNKYQNEKILKKYNLQDKIVLFTISRLVKRKGQDKTIEALKKIYMVNSDIHYFIAGIGEDEMYLKEIAGICPNIHFLGLISNDEKWQWLKSSDIFIMPARDIKGDFEGFGIVYLEAALASLPVIGGNAGGVKDAIFDGETGLLVDPRNVDDIAGAILKLAQDKELRKKMGAQGRKRAIRDFEWSRQIRKIYKYINYINI
ncbi:glycosyltransferase family 4 protein [Candidatus Parcubacteria bacterium]|nr:glycosyltransferase family 4 protein [Candidatus Parcubacteria bacterium]